MTRLRALLAALTALVLAASPALPAGASALPYSDSATVGRITLCDTTGHVVTSGDVHVKPFVWRAVGSTPAPAPYDAAGRTATLFGFQPIDGVDPQLWSGEYLTASGTYTNPQHPMAPATAADPSLADFLGDYPPKWGGLIQLRLFLGAPLQPTMTSPYDAATIRVDGDRWTLVDGGTTGCGTGSAVSSENILPSVRKLGTPAPNATTDVAGRPAGGRGPSRQPGSAVPASATTAPAPAVHGSLVQRSAVADAKSSSGTSASDWKLGLIAGLAAVLAVTGGVARWWRRPARQHP